ncbi:putative RNA-directed DNA polymerase from transposon BS [Trichonephila clavipes]|nr:putative RNA-directed DNA polymerase from transposon BS [Trichonephila clavipes]
MNSVLVWIQDHPKLNCGSCRAFSTEELDAAFLGLNVITLPGRDGTHGQMISLLGPYGKQRLLDLLNDSWRLGRLPRDWKKAIVVPIRKIGKVIASAGSLRLIALNFLTWLGFTTNLVYTFLAGNEKVIPNDCEIGIFEDIVLSSSSSDTENVEESVNLALADVWSLIVNHKLSFSPLKSSVGFFSTNRKLYNFRLRILLNSHPLEIEKYPGCLGLILDPEIFSNRHLELLPLRARKRIKILK